MIKIILLVLSMHSLLAQAPSETDNFAGYSCDGDYLSLFIGVDRPGSRHFSYVSLVQEFLIMCLNHLSTQINYQLNRKIIRL